ncbi:MAG TPA: DUF4336 domain-containing protein [Coleofasciculaceae cyanobacterium]
MAENHLIKGQNTPQPGERSPRDWAWSFWPLLPIYPYGQRRTLRQEVLNGSIWTFDQLQGILYVTVPIRMTVIKLEEGGLLVYAPVAPTRECLRLMRQLEAEHGPVQYIILPTTSGLEHKVFVGPFARQFPTAQVYVAPDQWSFPVRLPLSWLGLPRKRTVLLPPNSSQTPFGNQFDYAILGPIRLGIGLFEEVAFFHKRSQTLLVTDTVLSVPNDPPAILQLDPYPLLFHARDDAFDQVEDSPTTRRKGWHRIALFAFYFRPQALEVVETGQSLKDAQKAPDRSRKALFGWYPFRWKEDWKRSFESLRGGGRLFVAPILQTLILNRAPQEVTDWVNHVASWPFHRIIPCHLDAPLRGSPHQFRQAFSFLRKDSRSTKEGNGEFFPLPEEDFELLRQIDARLTQQGITPPLRDY